VTDKLCWTESREVVAAKEDEIFSQIGRANYDAHGPALSNPHAEGGSGWHCQPAGCVARADSEGFTVLYLLFIQ
jgi:hypothetical protein